ncbi:hypothetical protein Ancab_036333 [Ancistrocladus abbreviatus]
MMKMARILKPRAFGKVPVRSQVIDVSSLSGFIHRAGISTIGQTAGENDRIYADYHVYKGKAALSASPVLPKFTKIESGGLRVDRRGVMMLTFSPAVGERKYNWEKKQVFALSVTEVGSLISLGPNDSCEFFHDPSMGSSNAGQVRKTLSVKAHADDVVNNIQQINERFTVPVTSGEFAVMRTAFSFALPFIMGWDRYTKQLPKSDHLQTTLGATASKVDSRYLDAEWDR